MASLSRAIEFVQEQGANVAGGPARLQIVLLLGAVLGLDAADKAAMAAIAGQLEQTFSVGNTGIGLLVAIVSFVGAICTLPVGALADRVNRKHILLAAIAIWTVAMVISGTATSFTYLLVARLFLGAVTAAAAPTVASLVGDFFPPQARGHAYGMIIAGEFVGIGVGFILAAEVSALLDWRWGLFLMSVPSTAIGWAIWRYLKEPARGGQNWLQVGQEDIQAEDQRAQNDRPSAIGGQEDSAAQPRALARRYRVQARQDLVVRGDPNRWNLWQALRYLIRIPTYSLLVTASSLGYYFFSGLRAFAMIYFNQHYHVGGGIVGAIAVIIGLGAIAGAILGGRISGALLRRGYISARIVLPGFALLVASLLGAPALWTSNILIGTILLTAALTALAAANAPIDAARLDIVPSMLWARGEAGRMALRGLFEGGAPLLFGAVAGFLGGGAEGLQWTFLIMLIPVLIAASLAIPARRTYPRDVATADQSTRSIRGGRQTGKT